jgi:hypothetical protein
VKLDYIEYQEKRLFKVLAFFRVVATPWVLHLKLGHHSDF